ncbi:MAG: MerR family transcriptional regulator [Rhodospirillaceae bacterium]|nr:MerR family transcriptional regulator [Rhodospirillaceae bacterium]
MASAHDDPPDGGPRHEERASSRRTKSAEAFRTISEVSGDVGVPQHVLRFWETKFSQIKPLKRGGGRRYYRPEDIDLIHRIRAWLYDDGYTLKVVIKLWREGGAAAPAGAGRTAAAVERAQAGGSGRSPAGASAPEPGRATADPPVLRRPEATPAAEDGSGPRDPGRPDAATADRISLDRATVASLMEGLEEVRDRLRGPPPDP